MPLLLAGTGADMSLINSSMPVGPVAGAIMGGFLLLALGVYCYRCYSHRRSHRCNGSLRGEARLGDSNIDFEDLDDANNGNVSLHVFVFLLIIVIKSCGFYVLSVLGYLVLQ